MDDDALWKRRFLVFTVVRLAGLALVLLGLGITFSDWLRPGGLPAAGLPLMLLGLAQTVLAPRLLKRIWRV
jgi:hypothetical protein